MPKGGGMLFKRKLTEFAQEIHKLKLALNSLREEFKSQKSDNSRQLLEFAELGEKMRRTYLRLSRIVKIDSEQSSGKEILEGQETEEKRGPREIRDAIERTM